MEMDKITIGDIVKLVNIINDEIADLEDTIMDTDGEISARILKEEVQKRKEYLDQILDIEISYMEYTDKKKLKNIFIMYPTIKVE